MQAALVLDCLRGANRERLDVACAPCGRPCWRVTKEEYYAGHCVSKQDVSGPLAWKLRAGNSDQTELTDLVQFI